MAQIVPDNSLGNESSIVVPNQNINGLDSDRIDGGAIRGSNLFHSFQEFNIDNGRGAYFANPENISNILSRVTGNNLSNILGTLGVLGNANLFLINPNGIVFGPNARLDVGGSFFASTADGILFENGVEFAASNPDAPPLLTINIPIGLNFRENPGSIENQSRVLDSRNGVVTGLQVPSGQTLGLIGGEIIVNNGALTAPGGRIELAGVSGQGSVQLQTEDGRINGLEISSNISRENITITNDATLNAVDNDGGDIRVDGRNVEISQFSSLFAGIAPEEGTSESLAGDVEINATENFQLLGGGSIANQVRTNAQGNAGDIRINANNVLVQATVTPNASERVSISSSSFGQGNAGNIIITANNRVSFDGESIISSIIEPGGEGLGGNIRIIAEDFSMSNGSQLQASTSGIGDAGNVDITANRSVSLEGIDTNGFPTAIFSSVDPGGVGNGGDINISTDSLSVSNGALLSSSARSSFDETLPSGEGNAGIININAAGQVSFDGIDSGAFSSLGLGATGSGGNIAITADSVFVSNGAVLSVDTSGFGNAGNIRINAQNLVSFDGVKEVSVGRVTTENSSGAFSTVEPGAVGNGGTISITARSVEILDGGTLTTSVNNNDDPSLRIAPGQGNAGSITINAMDNVLFEGGGASSILDSNAFGQGGEINITTRNLSVVEGAALDVSTFGIGDGGNITIEASGTVLFDMEGIAFTGVAPSAEGNSGNISIMAEDLSVINGSQLRVEVESFGIGKAGNIIVNGADDVLFDGASEFGRLSGAFASLEENAVGEAGNIDITANRLTVTNGAQLRVGTSGLGNAGNINIFANDSVLFAGGAAGEGFNPFPSAALSSVGFTGIGNSGDITITTGSLSVLNGAFLETAVQLPSFPGRDANAGEIQINASGNVIFDGGSSVDSFQQIGDREIFVSENSGKFFISQAITSISSANIGSSGDIIINAENLEITNGARLVTINSGEGQSGNIDINVRNNVIFDGVGQFDNLSRASTTSSAFAGGESGDINISSTNLSVTNGAQLDASVDPFSDGLAGNIVINVTENVIFDGFFENEIGRFPSGVFATIADRALGSGGAININAENISLTNGAQLQAQVRGVGTAGDVILNAHDSIFLDGSESGIFTTVEQDAIGSGGNIDITASNISLNNFATLSSQTEGEGDAGNISVTTTSFSASEGAQVQAQTGGIGNAGNISINANNSISIDDGLISTIVDINGIGEGGEISINTGNMFVVNGGQIQAQTAGTGNAGSIIINASDNIFFDEINEDGFPSAIFTFVDTEALGNGGEIIINARNIAVTNGANFSAATLGFGTAGTVTINTAEQVYFNEQSVVDSGVGAEASGNGGEINIDTQDIIFQNGARLSTSTLGQGNAGSVNITTDQFFFDGGSILASAFVDSNGNAGSINITASELVELRQQASDGNVGVLLAETASTGAGGDVTIQTEQLRILDEAGIFVNSSASGIPGNINISTSETLLNNQGQVSASSEAGEGGNIRLESNDVRLLNGSEIRAIGSGSGETFEGNIEIDADLLVLLGGSRIITNAFSPSGGSNISIRPFTQPTVAIVQSVDSTILAAGNLTIDSSVTFQPAEVPEVAVTDPNDLIAQEFCRQRGGSEFVITGKGGLAADPNDKADGNQINVDLVEPVPSRPRNSSQRRSETEDNQPVSSLDIVPARGWIRDENGDVILVSYDPTKTGVRRQPSQLPQCQPNLNND